MKKKSVMFLITVTLVIAAFALAGPATAGKGHLGRAVFEADIVAADTGSDALDMGRVSIRKNGKFRVKIKGARSNTDYKVYLVYGQTLFPTENLLGILTTDRKGKGKLYGDVCVTKDFVSMPWVELRSVGPAGPVGPSSEPGLEPEPETLQFITGFAPVPCEPAADPEPPVEPPDESYPGPSSGPSES